MIVIHDICELLVATFLATVVKTWSDDFGYLDQNRIFFLKLCIGYWSSKN